jgi:ABC-2 type transport system ATP-binding protein
MPSGGDDDAIRAVGLVKRFGGRPAVDGLDLSVGRGQIVGLLGPNGAGKTTTVRLLATLIAPDAGAARILGCDLVRDAARIRARISLTGQFASVDEDLTGWENLVLFGRLLGLGRRAARARAEALLAAFDLADARHRQARSYSGGMRRRLDIAASLLRTPALLFLDEPTTGLDPLSRNRVWDLVRRLAGEGVTVLLTTQYLEEADQLADRIVVIDHGRVVAEDTPARLKASVGSGALHVRLAEPLARDAACRLLARHLARPVDRGADPRALTARLDEAAEAAGALAVLAAAGFAVTDFSFGQPSLDEVFLALTGHAAVDDADGAAGADRRPPVPAEPAG